uniref:Uncharacterized protein n=1 Tax=Chenopodium quinoa TaxID=63459 RepID=A0A803N5Z4_CHEQI
MKERQRWTTEEDALLSAYVKQYGPREWHLVSQRMNTLLDRDAKSCLERWKNYLKPGIKKEVPGRTAKRLGKWWKVYKEKQERTKKETSKCLEPIEEGKYDHILETFAEKLVKERTPPRQTFLMATSNGLFLHSDHPSPPVPPPPPVTYTTTMLPPWLSTSNGVWLPSSPSVTLSLSSSIVPTHPPTPVTWVPQEMGSHNIDNYPLTLGCLPSCAGAHPEQMIMSELMDCCRELDEGHHALAAHKKEAAWRLNRVELQLESEKANRKREKMEEIEEKINALKDEQKASIERIEAECREQLAGLRRDAEAKEQKLAEQWVTKHTWITKLLDQMGCRTRVTEPS